MPPLAPRWIRPALIGRTRKHYTAITNGADDRGNIDSQPRLDVGYVIKR